MPAPVQDTRGRPLRSLRISVTDRCNLRCAYCMPERDYLWLAREHLLTFAELAALAEVFAGLGVDRLRLTGGEPLLRSDLPVLVGNLAAVPGIRDLALTTNGILLTSQAADLRSAGLQRVTISLDTLRADRFRELTGRDQLAATLRGLDAAAAGGFAEVKINTVVMRGTNEDEIVSMLEFAGQRGAEVRFIEYMDVGGATDWTSSTVFSRAEILRSVEARLGPATPVRGRGSAPATRYTLADGTTFGIIASTTQPFCSACDRARITADGMLYRCLYARAGLDLRAPLRAGAAPAELRALIEDRWRRRTDRGAEERVAMRERAPLVPVAELRDDPHLEMHTRGG